MEADTKILIVAPRGAWQRVRAQLEPTALTGRRLSPHRLEGTGTEQLQSLLSAIKDAQVLHLATFAPIHWVPMLGQLKGLLGIALTPLSPAACEVSDLVDRVVITRPRIGPALCRPAATFQGDADTAQSACIVRDCLSLHTGLEWTYDRPYRAFKPEDVSESEWPAFCAVITAVIDQDLEVARRALGECHGTAFGVGAWLLSRSLPMSAGERIASLWAARRNLGPRSIVLHDLGCAYAMAGCASDARRSFEEAIAVDPTLLRSWIQRIQAEPRGPLGVESPVVDWVRRFTAECPGAHIKDVAAALLEGAAH